MNFSFKDMAEMKPYVHLLEDKNENLFIRYALHVKAKLKLEDADWVSNGPECGVCTYLLDFKKDENVADSVFLVGEIQVPKRIDPKKHRSPAFKVKATWPDLPGQGSTMIGQEDADDNP